VTIELTFNEAPYTLPAMALAPSAAYSLNVRELIDSGQHDRNGKPFPSGANLEATAGGSTVGVFKTIDYSDGSSADGCPSSYNSSNTSVATVVKNGCVGAATLWRMDR
jgi:hypothetical protein